MKSILHKKDGTCFLCRLEGDEGRKVVEEHHVFGGPNRKHSEKYGLKVYLCIAHHREGKQAVHRNHEKMLLLQQVGQSMFEKTRTRSEFMKIFGKNFL